LLTQRIVIEHRRADDIVAALAAAASIRMPMTLRCTCQPDARVSC
jgi:hypothetical protein